MSMRTANGATRPAMIASPRHTVLLIAILLLVAAAGAISRPARPVSGSVAASLLPTYASVLVAELLLLYFVWRGIRRTDTSVRDLVAGRWTSPRGIAVDLLVGVGLWGCLSTLAAVWTQLSGIGASRSVVSLLPSGPAETVVWTLLSLCAGVVEEIVFRGYLQRQLWALTGSAALGVVGQAIVFGVSHGYQGVNACARITAIGLLFGVVARWRSSL